jgi:hypothetical protein
MKTSTMQARSLRPAISKITIALVFASVISGIAMTPALAENNDRHDEHQDNGRHNGESHADRDRHGGYQQPHYYHSQPVYAPPRVYYSQPVYAPPPVYYPPQQSPGISFFLPLNINIH